MIILTINSRFVGKPEVLIFAYCATCFRPGLVIGKLLLSQESIGIPRKDE